MGNMAADGVGSAESGDVLGLYFYDLSKAVTSSAFSRWSTVEFVGSFRGVFRTLFLQYFQHRYF